MNKKPTYEELKQRIQELEQAESDGKQAEKSLIIFKQSLENSTDAIGISTPEGRHYYQNKMFTKMFGNIGENPPDTLYVDKNIGEEVFRTIMSGQQWTGEVKLYAKDGQVLDIFLRAYANKDDIGKITALVGIHTNITKSKYTEDALRQSQTILNAAIDQSPSGIIIADAPDVTIRKVNAAALGIRGASKEQLMNIQVQEHMAKWQTFYPNGNPCPSEQLPLSRAVLQGEVVCEEEIIIRDHLGQDHLVSANAAPIRDSEGHIVAGIVVFHDLTHRKQAEEQLRQAQKMDSVGRLAGGIAHDFNNMLSIIMGHTEMILEDLDPANPSIGKLYEIQKATERSTNLTRQLLAFARKQTIAPKILDLNETIEGMLKMLRRLIGENINLAWRPQISLSAIKIDPSQVDQILANLCVNARDAIEDIGRITIETDNVRFDDDYCREHKGYVPGDFVMIAVSDNGCGIEKNIQNNLFEPFFTTKGIGEGTGLGLATVYGIVKQNNGFLNVYSEPGKGTTFRIYFPRHADTVQQIKKTESKKDDAIGSETILLVEDEEAIIEMITIMLKRLGYTVLKASNPTDALKIGESYTQKIDLLMTDVVMPEMNGRDLSKKINQLLPDLKCLFMSGYTANVIAHHGVLDDGMQFIQKPFSRQDLAAKVRKVIDEN